MTEPCSFMTKVVAIISISFIIISTVVLTLNTLPYFSSRGQHVKQEKDFPPFALLEAIYMSWFTFEFVVSTEPTESPLLQALFLETPY